MSMETSTKLPTLIIKLIAVVGKLVQWNWNVEQRKQGFIFSILWCSYTSYHPLEDLAKFGYGSKRKVKKFIIFWLHLLSKYDSLKKNFKIWWLDWVHFFPQKSFVWVVVDFTKNMNPGRKHWTIWLNVG
jgi:hypothetical protein